MLVAILFDLDDTLFDHRHCARAALTAVHRSQAVFGAVAFDDFEREHVQHLETLHRQVLAGEIGIDAARIERFRRLFASVGAATDTAADAASIYRAQYVAVRRAVPGARALLGALRRHARIAIVSNNLLNEQQDKMRQCGLDAHVDALVVSEETGSWKPDPEIFRIALERVRAEPSEAIMIGDSWTADIEGARAIGMPAIWFNPLGLDAPDPLAGVPELRSFEPVDRVAEWILASHRRASGN